MGKHNKVKVPFELLSRIIYLLEQLDLSIYDAGLQSDYNDILIALTRKKQSVELREAYARIIYSPDEESRINASINYMQYKQDLEIPF